MKHIMLSCLFLFCNVCSPHDLSAIHTFKELDKLSCYDLMSKLVKTSSLRELFKDKSMDLDFSFERDDELNIRIVLLTIDNPKQNSVYSNLSLNLMDFSLNGIDPEPSIPIKINKKYVPFIKEKCTPEENVYIHTGRLDSHD